MNFLTFASVLRAVCCNVLSVIRSDVHFNTEIIMNITCFYFQYAADILNSKEITWLYRESTDLKAVFGWVIFSLWNQLLQCYDPMSNQVIIGLDVDFIFWDQHFWLYLRNRIYTHSLFWLLFSMFSNSSLFM